uniref:Uncharacterized protein n=1 Tax=Strombidium inclinatum TaxID=197538 RepID=A0A7S3IZY3_9SPIT|mmetsp:Transcript_9656/g.14695  ORF Transcript_9656/g.14695 Transcript_9656/m.14695 type:complete len:126 (+) Transcript_9656:152-529(+)
MKTGKGWYYVNVLRMPHIQEVVPSLVKFTGNANSWDDLNKFIRSQHWERGMGFGDAVDFLGGGSWTNAYYAPDCRIFNLDCLSNTVLIFGTHRAKFKKENLLFSMDRVFSVTGEGTSELGGLFEW